jgi:hypothetical protein
MGVIKCTFALLVAGTLTLSAQGADLTKIDRTIAKEPAYHSKPKYCLLVFGPEAKTRVWLVRDGDILYVDRNGNGDLTEEGERVVSKGGQVPVFQAGDITEAGGRVKHSELVVQFHDEEKWTLLTIAIKGKGRQAASLGERSLRFGASPQDAPVVHFDGPLTVRLLERMKVGEGEVFIAEIGTPGLGAGTFATIDPQYPGVIPKGIFPVAQVTYPSKNGARPIRASIALNRREH